MTLTSVFLLLAWPLMAAYAWFELHDGWLCALLILWFVDDVHRWWRERPARGAL